MRKMTDFLPDWAHAWVEVITVGLQIALIVLATLLLRALLHRFIQRLGQDRHLPLEFVVGGRRLISVVLFGTCCRWCWTGWGCRAPCCGPH